MGSKEDKVENWAEVRHGVGRDRQGYRTSLRKESQALSSHASSLLAAPSLVVSPQLSSHPLQPRTQRLHSRSPAWGLRGSPGGEGDERSAGKANATRAPVVGSVKLEARGVGVRAPTRCDGPTRSRDRMDDPGRRPGCGPLSLSCGLRSHIPRAFAAVVAAAQSARPFLPSAPALGRTLDGELPCPASALPTGRGR